MNKTDILNSPVTILVSDPWDFGTECGTQPFSGTIIERTSQRVLIELARPISYRGKAFHKVIAQARHVGEMIGEIGTSQISANLILLPQSANTLRNINAESTKDGIGVIGTITVK